MKSSSYFIVTDVDEDVARQLRTAFLVPMNGAARFTCGCVEMDFLICSDGSLSLKRISSSNADLYSWFRKQAETVRIRVPRDGHLRHGRLTFSGNGMNKISIPQPVPAN